jgi:hypothetical protein
MPAKRNIEMANITAGLYDGSFSVSYDCVEQDKCKWAMFFCMPPDPDDDCLKKQGCQCNHPMAARNALIALRDRITVELEQYEIPED